jgi:hypothetical protein
LRTPIDKDIEKFNRVTALMNQFMNQVIAMPDTEETPKELFLLGLIHKLVDYSVQAGVQLPMIEVVVTNGVKDGVMAIQENMPKNTPPNPNIH